MTTIRLLFTDVGLDALQNTITHLRYNTRSFNLRQWAETFDKKGSSFILTRMDELLATRNSECRTVCCIAGWIAYIGGEKADESLSIEQAALRVLFRATGLPDRPLYFPLFHPTSWHTITDWQDTSDESAANVARNLQRLVEQRYIEFVQASAQACDWTTVCPTGASFSPTSAFSSS